MEIFDDFKELFECLNRASVKYVVVGGYAVAFHGAPRFTGDIDVYVEPDVSNADRIIEALNEYGFGGLDLSSSDFVVPGKVVQLGNPPIRVDFLTSIDGVDWPDVWGGRVEAEYGDIPINYIGRSELVRNKQSTTRLKDKADLEALREEGIPDGDA